MKTYLCIDPGKKTGMAILQWEGDEMTVTESWEVDDWREAASQAEYAIRKGAIDEVVTEDFVILKKTASQWSILCNGVVEWACWRHGVPLTGQNSQRAKTFSTNKKLKALGIWHVGGDGHANDAIRHGLLHAVNQGFRSLRMVV